MSDVCYVAIPGALGYRVGDDGTVISCRDEQGRMTDRWRHLSLYRRPYGARYVVVCLRPIPNGKVVQRYVHRLVLDAFKGECPPGLECRHLDGDTSNNRVENLCWGTRQENIDDQERHGTRRKGVKNHAAKLTDEDVIEIRRRRREGSSPSELSKEFNISRDYVATIVRGGSWKHLPL